MLFFKPQKYTSYYRYKYDYANRLRHKYSSLDPYSNLLREVSKRKVVESQIDIKLLSQISFNTSKKEIKKLLGRPRQEISLELEVPTRILYYRKRIGQYRVKVELHFYQDSLFHFLYDFSSRSSCTTDHLDSLIAKKYLNGTLLPEQGIICDSKSNFLYIATSMNPSLHYFAQKHSFFHDLETFNQINQSRLKKQEHNHIQELLQNL